MTEARITEIVYAILAPISEATAKQLLQVGEVLKAGGETFRALQADATAKDTLISALGRKVVELEARVALLESAKIPCPDCSGSGKRYNGNGHEVYDICPTCGGTKFAHVSYHRL